MQKELEKKRKRKRKEKKLCVKTIKEE